MKALVVVLIVGVFVSLGRAESIEPTQAAFRCVIETQGAHVMPYSAASQELLWMPKIGLDDNPIWRHGGIPIAWSWFGRIESDDGSIWAEPLQPDCGARGRLV